MAGICLSPLPASRGLKSRRDGMRRLHFLLVAFFFHFSSTVYARADGTGVKVYKALPTPKVFDSTIGAHLKHPLGEYKISSSKDYFMKDSPNFLGGVERSWRDCDEIVRIEINLFKDQQTAVEAMQARRNLVAASIVEGKPSLMFGKKCWYMAERGEAIFVNEKNAIIVFYTYEPGYKKVKARQKALLKEVIQQLEIANLVARLGEEDAGRAGYSRLVSIGKPAVPGVIEGLNSADALVRWRAVQILGAIKDETAVEPLLTVLNDQDSRVRRYAASFLCTFGGKEVFEPVLALLDDPEPEVRYNVAGALGRLGDKRAVEPLIKALEDKSVSVRANAARSLGELADPEAITPLVTALSDENWSVRRNAAQAIGEIGDVSIVPRLKKIFEDRKEQPRFRGAAIIADAKLNDKTAIEPLARILNDKSEPLEVRRAAAEAFCSITDEKAREALLQGLRDEDKEIRRYSARALVNYQDNESAQALIKTLNDEWDPVVVWAASSLALRKEKSAIPALAKTLNEREDVWISLSSLYGSVGDVLLNALEAIDRDLEFKMQWFPFDSMEEREAVVEKWHKFYQKMNKEGKR